MTCFDARLLDQNPLFVVDFVVPRVRRRTMHIEKDNTESGDGPVGTSPQQLSQTGRYIGVACLGALVLLAFWLRVNKISEPVLGHVEIFVPGIDLPAQASSPAPRHQFVKTVLSVIHSEPHPPGFYIFMLAWAKVFGSSELALRMPVVLMGTGVVLVIGMIGVQLVGYRTGCLAALIFATNPTCIAFDRTARMYPFAAFLAVLGTALLIWSYRSTRWQWLILAGYLTTMALGLFSTVFFWPMLGAHLAFSMLGPRNRQSSAPPVHVHWQLGLMIIASPLISIAIYQSGRPSYVSTVLYEQMICYLQLFYAFPVEAMNLPTRFSTLSSFGIMFAIISGIILALGIYWTARNSPPITSALPVKMSLSTRLQLLATLFAMIVIGAFTYAQTIFENYYEDRTNLLLASLALPPMFCAIDFVIRRQWEKWSPSLDRLLRLPLGLNWVAVACAVIPVAFVGSVTAIGLPLFEARTVYVAAPFVALLAGMGAMAVPNKWLGTGIVMIVAVSANMLGMECYAERFAGSVDYRELVQGVNQKHDESDLILIKNHYAVTPVFYHLDHRQMKLVFDAYARAIEKHPECRAWVFQPQGLPLTKDIEQALRGHQRTHSVEARGMRAHLYEPRSTSSQVEPSS